MWSLNFIVINKTFGGGWNYLKCFYFCKYVILDSESIINILLNEFSYLKFLKLELVTLLRIYSVHLHKSFN